MAHHKNLISKPPPRTAENRHDAMMRTLKYLSPQVEAHARAVCTFPLVWRCCPMPLTDLEAAVLAMDAARRGQGVAKKGPVIPLLLGASPVQPF